VPQHRDPTRPPSSGRAPRAAVRRTAPVPAALLAALLLAACTAGPDAEGGSGPAGPAEDHAAHGDHAQHDGRVAVGPLDLPAAEYWSVIQPGEGVTEVRAGGCPQDAACPRFEVLAGAALDAVPADAAYVPDGATCPGADALAAEAAGPAGESAVEVGGTPATLTRWTLSCVDADGAEVRTSEQLQWYVADAPGGPVLVVDRWAFEGLESRLAAGTWNAA